MKPFRNGLILSTCLGIILPHPALFAAATHRQDTANDPAAKQATQTIDIKLSSTGSFKGYLTTETGKPIVGQKVTIAAEKFEQQTVKTDSRGQFEFKTVRTGLFVVSINDKGQLVRLWNPNIAPPKAKPALVATIGADNVVRGQGGFPWVDTRLLILLAALGAVIAIAASDSDDDDDPPPVSP